MDRTSECERWIEILKRQIAALQTQLTALAQQQRAINAGGYGGSGSGNIYGLTLNGSISHGSTADFDSGTALGTITVHNASNYDIASEDFIALNCNGVWYAIVVYCA